MKKVKRRKIPLRTCLGCQEQKTKKELIRIVRTPSGSVEIDLTGKKAGRGAYICNNRDCLERAVKAKRIEKSLEHKISPEVFQNLTHQIPQVETDEK